MPSLNLYDTSWPIRGIIIDHRPSERFHSGSDNQYSHIARILATPGVTVGQSTRLKQTIVAEGCHIPYGLAIGLDSEEDARWFTRTPNGITLITARALQQRALHRKLFFGQPSINIKSRNP